MGVSRLAIRPGGRLAGRAVLTMSFGCICALLAAPSCLTVPPPGLPLLEPERPTILHDAVQPLEGDLLAWPVDDTFLVPVQVSLPNETFTYEVFVDYPSNPDPVRSAPAPLSVSDAGFLVVSFQLAAPYSSACPHQIEFLVGHSFSAPHTFDGVGGDDVIWDFYPDGSTECPSSPREGGVDESTDALPDE